MVRLYGQIGVELAAKPSLLLFLDEPTSGLSSEGALQMSVNSPHRRFSFDHISYSGRFIKTLAEAGQSCLCTVHQPSSQLFTE